MCSNWSVSFQFSQTAMVSTAGGLCTHWSVSDAAQSVHEPPGHAHTAHLSRRSPKKVNSAK